MNSILAEHGLENDTHADDELGSILLLYLLPWDPKIIPGWPFKEGNT
jgi:hypothetical protein